MSKEGLNPGLAFAPQITANDHPDLPADEILHERILSEGIRLSKGKGEFLCRQGSPASDVYALVGGTAGVTVRCDKADRHYLSFLVAPTLVIPATDANGDALYSVECLTHADLYTVSRRTMMRLMDGRSVRTAIELNLGKTLCRTNDQLSNLLCRHGAARVAYLLTALTSEPAEPCAGSTDSGTKRNAIELTQVEIASALGMSSVYLNQILKKFKDSGLICIESGAIKVKDKKSLRMRFMTV